MAKNRLLRHPPSQGAMRREGRQFPAVELRTKAEEFRSVTKALPWLGACRITRRNLKNKSWRKGRGPSPTDEPVNPCLNGPQEVALRSNDSNFPQALKAFFSRVCWGDHEDATSAEFTQARRV